MLASYLGTIRAKYTIVHRHRRLSFGIGCTLLQRHDDGKPKPIGYRSRTISHAEQNYSAPERESLAVVWALQTLSPYSLYETFTAYSNPSALYWLMNITEVSVRLTRWRLNIAEYDFQITYKKRSENARDDALSRLLTSATSKPNNAMTSRL